MKSWMIPGNVHSGSQTYPGLHPKQCGQQGKEEDSALYSAPHLEYCNLWDQVHRRPRKVIRGTEHISSKKKAERVGAVQPEEEKALGRLFSSLPVFKVGQKERW